MTTDMEIRNLADAIAQMIERWRYLAELREQRKHARKIRRQRKESA